MPITNTCFLDWAKSAMEGGITEEVHLRAVVSRSYYAAYHIALDYAETTLGIPVGSLGGSVHQKLAGLLTEYKCEDAERQGMIRRLGTRISVLHSLRIRADYFLDETVQVSDATSIIKNVIEIAGMYHPSSKVSAA
jgi:hypothetical protein